MRCSVVERAMGMAAGSSQKDKVTIWAASR